MMEDKIELPNDMLSLFFKEKCLKLLFVSEQSILLSTFLNKIQFIIATSDDIEEMIDEFVTFFFAGKC